MVDHLNSLVQIQPSPLKKLKKEQKMTNINWKLFSKTFPFICDGCKTLHHENRVYCEKCGKEGKLRKTLKIDYKLKKRKK